jgi:uncharacterized protein
MPKTRLIPLVALALAAAALPASAHDPGPAPPSVVVNGAGQVREAPDQAVVRLGVEAQATQAREAQQRANAVAQRIAEGLRALKIPAENVQTSELYLSPLYQQPRPEPDASKPVEPRVVGYRASNVVSVRLDDLAQVGPAIDAAIAAGANRVEGVDFQLRDDLGARPRQGRGHRRRARRRAGARARGAGGWLLRPAHVRPPGHGRRRDEPVHPGRPRRAGGPRQRDPALPAGPPASRRRRQLRRDRDRGATGLEPRSTLESELLRWPAAGPESRPVGLALRQTRHSRPMTPTYPSPAA